jgi:hypothetical protein
MKIKILLTVSMIGLIFSIYAQEPTMTLTFTAKDNGQHIPLDSIYIENMTQGGDTSLYAPDTVLILDYITNVGEEQASGNVHFFLSQNYPNPFSYNTKVDLFISNDQNINISVRDLNGREISRLTLSLKKGVHSFTIYPGKENIYLLTISGEQDSKTITLLNSASWSVHSSQFKIVHNTIDEKGYRFKTIETLNGFAFNLGDLLRYTGYAIMLNGNPGSDLMEDNPLTSTLYEFDITDNLPTVTTDSVTDITNTSATSGGDVTSDGGSSVTARGVCWSTSPDPTLSDDYTIDGSGIGIFISSITDLLVNTQYYVRAYATNSVGSSYGKQVIFTTYENVALPTVTTDSVYNITYYSATSGGEVTSDGGASVTARGVCWSISPDPTLADYHTIDGTGTGTFVSSVGGLASFTEYYLRAYATNSIGISYGDQVIFTMWYLLLLQILPPL